MKEAFPVSALITAFITIFIAEFGDKTQLVSLSMASRYPPLQVLGGALSALSLVLAMAILAGKVMATYLPPPVLIAGSGGAFVIMGLYTAVKKERVSDLPSGKTGFYQTLGMVFLAEIGDKTQIAAMLLAANLGRPLFVFFGAMLAMAANHSLAVFIGSRLLSRINPRYVKIGTALLFIAIGLILIFSIGRL